MWKQERVGDPSGQAAQQRMRQGTVEDELEKQVKASGHLKRVGEKTLQMENMAQNNQLQPESP